MKDLQTVFYNSLYREQIILLTLGRKIILWTPKILTKPEKLCFSRIFSLERNKNTLHFITGFIAESLGQLKSLAKLSELDNGP